MAGKRLSPWKVVAFVSFMLLAPSLAFMRPVACNAMSMDVTPGDSPVLMLSGEIVRGDAEKVRRILDRETGNIDGGVIYFDSPGGDYEEALRLGEAIFEKGWTTRVSRGSTCLSACAFAFLGGKFYGASGGWGVAREVEAGATLGFTSFAGDQGRLGDGKSAGRRMPEWRFYAYASKLGIKPEVITLILSRKGGLLPVNTPALLGALGIKTTDFPNPRQSVSGPEAIQLMVKMLSAQSNDWEFNPRAMDITRLDFRRDMLARLAESDQSEKYPEIKAAITAAIQSRNKKEVDRVYNMMEALGAAPAEPDGKIIKVEGLDNIHYYKSRIAYVFQNNNGSDLSLSYVVCPENTFFANQGCEIKSPEKLGIYYDLYPADKPLWEVRR